MSNDVTDFLNQSSGSKYPSFKFTTVGDGVAGTIVEAPKMVTMPSLTPGKPDDLFMVISVQPNNTVGEDAIVSVWVKKGYMAGAIADAVRAAGASELAEGGRIGIKFTATKPSKFPQPAKLFEAVYAAPVKSGLSLDDLGV